MYSPANLLSDFLAVPKFGPYNRVAGFNIKRTSRVWIAAIDVPFPAFRKGFRSDINTIPEKADELRKQYGGTEATLCEAVEAEKQHVVPYKRLKKVFHLEGKARPEA